MKRMLLVSCLFLAAAGMHTNISAQADNCDSATVITANLICVSTSGTSSGATQEFSPTSCSGNTASAALDVWYQFTTDGAPSFIINVTGTAGFDPVLGLYSSCAAGSLISCVDTTGNDGTETINAGILPAGTYYYRIYGANGGTGNFNTCVVRTSPLPIELVSFIGECDEQTGNRNLQWVTASEINNSHFIIERSDDAMNWIFAARVPSLANGGNSNIELLYAWSDTELFSASVYYRLTQTDFDGNSEVFNPLYLYCHPSNATALIWPNPNDGNFNLVFNEKPGIKVLLTLNNNMGDVLQEHTVVSTGVTTVSFNKQLTPGIYYLTIFGTSAHTLKVRVE